MEMMDNNNSLPVIEVVEEDARDAGDDGDESDAGDESALEGQTQETFTQNEMSQANGELTQLGIDDDENDDDDSQKSMFHSPTPIDPLTIPWGRLMPVGSNGSNGINGHNGSNFDKIDPAYMTARGALEMTPRPPIRAGSISTRSRSPSVSEHWKSPIRGSQSSQNYSQHSQYSQQSHNPQSPQSPPGINFLGLKHLMPSDRFNEYVLGRSVKCDVTTQKIETQPASREEDASMQKMEAKRKQNDHIHAMISNRHCRIFCLLQLPDSNVTNHNNQNIEMEVYVEDTSGNGTLINGTTLLRRNERRKLHTGDVICMINPKLLTKKIRSGYERKVYMGWYSYVFVNLFEQEARHAVACGHVGGSTRVTRFGSLGSSNTPARRRLSGQENGKWTGVGKVNVRATKCHSITSGRNDRNERRDRSSSKERQERSGNRGRVLFPAEEPLENDCKNNRDHRNGGQNRNDQIGGVKPPAHSSDSSKPSKASSNLLSIRRIEEEYDLRDLLGTGTNGEVRRAIHRRTGEQRAVKIISISGRGATGVGRGVNGGGVGAGALFSAAKLSSIQAEAAILRKLDHPYVVQLYDVFITPGKAIYLVMELIKGGDLFDRIVERGRYSEVAARRVFRRILSAVYYLHEGMGIVHRDLKPENILVVNRNSDVNIKLTDFGVAKNMTAEGLKTFCGTPQYFAPEVLRRHNNLKSDTYGKEADCWSIGVILFILLSGSPPFDVSAGFDAVANARIVFYEDMWEGISEEARDLVMCLLEKDPLKRMSVKDACEHEWVLKKDGDSHCHPLDDPVCREKISSLLEKSKQERAPELDGCPKRNVSPQCKNSSPTDVDLLNSTNHLSKEKQDLERNLGSKFNNSQSTSEKLSDDREIQGTNTQTSRATVPTSPTKEKSKSVSKVIQQAIDGADGSLLSAPESPLRQRRLFERNPSNDRSIRKVRKQHVEYIKSAGISVPKPFLHSNPTDKNRPEFVKKEVGSNENDSNRTKSASKQDGRQSLFSSVVDDHHTFSKQQQQRYLINDKRRNFNKKAEDMQTSTKITPKTDYGCEVSSFLKRKDTAGSKSITPESREDVNILPSTSSRKNELPEDELQSDFSDNEDSGSKREDSAVVIPSGFAVKNPFSFSKANHSKKVGSPRKAKRQAEGSFSIANQQMETNFLQSDEEMPPPAAKPKRSPAKSKRKTCEKEVRPSDEPSRKKRKLVQTFLFGKSPPGGIDSVSNIDSDTDSNHAEEKTNSETTGSKPLKKSAAPHTSNTIHPTENSKGSKRVDLRRQSSGDSVGTVPKGKQKTIKSWFQPKK